MRSRMPDGWSAGCGGRMTDAGGLTRVCTHHTADEHLAVGMSLDSPVARAPLSAELPGWTYSPGDEEPVGAGDVNGTDVPCAVDGCPEWRVGLATTCLRHHEERRT